MTPLELGVFNDIVERVENHAKHGAYVRVRIKNIGNRPTKKVPLVSDMDTLRVIPQRGRESKTVRNWTEEETEQLRVLYCVELSSLPDIAEKLERTEAGVREKINRLGITRRRYGRDFKIPTVYRSNNALEAARRIRERRQREAEQERVAD